MNATRQSINDAIINTLLVYDAVVKPKQLSKDFLLPNYMEALLIKMNKASLVSEDSKLGQLKVCVPLLNSKKNRHIFFLIGRKALTAWSEGLADIS